MAGIPILDTQGFGIPAKGHDQDVAAKFLEFMHSPERVQAMWTLSRQIPANTTFDASVVDDPLIKSVQQKWVAGDHNVYIADLMPTKFWTDAMFIASQKILAGDMTGDQAGDLAHDVTETWKKQNPDMVENYTKWGQDLNA
jgi:ABC-type glycerol-3-phosphate transport system substrate-binding protein